MAYLNSKFLLSATFLLLAMTLAGAKPAMALVKPLDRIAVVVDNDIIMESQVIKRMKDVTEKFKTQNLPAPPKNALLRKVVELLIMESVQIQIGERVGVRIDDSTLNQTIERIARKNGLTLESFQQALEKDGISYHATREQIRREMIISRVRDGRVRSRIQITDQEVQDYMASEAGKTQLQAEYRLGHILLSLPETTSADEITTVESQINNLYEQLISGANFATLAKEYSAGPDAAKGGDMDWRQESQLPSLFADIAPQMNTGDISRPIRAGNGFHIIKILEKKGGDSIMVPQTRARHILLKPSEIITEEQVQSLATQLRDRIVAGESFAELAKNHSDDTASLADGGDLGWMSSDELVPEFSKVMDNAKIGAVSEPFKSRYGWHILQVLERRQHNMSAEIKRRRAEDMIYQRKFNEEVEIWLREEREDAYVDIKLY